MNVKLTKVALMHLVCVLGVVQNGGRPVHNPASYT